MSSVLSRSNSSSPRPLVETGARGRVVQYLRENIASGEWGAGQILPSAQKLSESLDVNRRTVYAALDLLRQEGLIRSNGGKIQIVARSQASASRLMGETVVVFTYFPESAAPFPVEGGSLAEITRSIYTQIIGTRQHVMTFAHAEIERRDVSMLLGSDRPAGVIFADISDNESPFLGWARALRDGGVPVALFGEDEVMSEFDHVASDHFEGARKLTHFLLEKGARNPLCLWGGPLQRAWQERRAQGFSHAMQEAGLQAQNVKHWPLSGHGWKVDEAAFDHEVRTLMGYLFEHFQGARPIDALLAQTDLEFFLLAAACRRLGREPGRDVLLVGYDNMWQNQPMRAFESAVPLATVDKCNAQIGSELVSLILDRQTGKSPTEPQKRVIEPHILPTT